MYLKVGSVGVPDGVHGFWHLIVQQPQYQVQEVASQIIEHDSFTTLIYKNVENICNKITDEKSMGYFILKPSEIYFLFFGFDLCQPLTSEYFVVWKLKLYFTKKML